MAEMIIRPTMKFIYLGYLLVIVIVVASVVALMRVQQWPSWIPAGFATLDSLAARAPFAVAVKAPSPQPPDQDDNP